MGANGATAERLKTIEDKIDYARDKLAAIKAQPTDFKDPEGLMRETFERLQKYQDEQVELLSELGTSNGNGGGLRGVWDLDGLDDPRVKSMLEEVSASGAPFNRLPLGEAIGARALARELGSVAKADIAVGANARHGEFAGIAGQPRRQLSLLDLVSTAPMTGASVPYLIESGSFDTALETAEGTAKPEGSAGYADAIADAATIAHWLKLRKQSLADVDGLRTAIDGRLRYGCCAGSRTRSSPATAPRRTSAAS